MCKLEIKTKIPQGKKFCIEIESEKRLADEFTEKVEFELPKGEHTVKITEIYESTYNKLGWWIFYILLFPVIALLNVIFLNTEDDVPDLFLAEAGAKINLAEAVKPLELLLTAKEGKQKGVCFTLSGSAESDTAYTFSREKLMDYFWGYIKRVLSAVLLCAALFAFLLYQGIASGNAVMIILCAVILAAVLVLFVFLAKKKCTHIERLKKQYDIL